jgi:hypothetical protein
MCTRMYMRAQTYMTLLTRASPPPQADVDSWYSRRGKVLGEAAAARFEESCRAARRQAARMRDIALGKIKPPQQTRRYGSDDDDDDDGRRQEAKKSTSNKRSREVWSDDGSSDEAAKPKSKGSSASRMQPKVVIAASGGDGKDSKDKDKDPKEFRFRSVCWECKRGGFAQKHFSTTQCRCVCVCVRVDGMDGWIGQNHVYLKFWRFCFVRVRVWRCAYSWTNDACVLIHTCTHIHTHTHTDMHKHNRTDVYIIIRAQDQRAASRPRLAHRPARTAASHDAQEQRRQLRRQTRQRIEKPHS